MITVSVGMASNVGKRDNQEDSLGAMSCPDGNYIAIVADGVGGHSDGEVASNLCVESVLNYIPGRYKKANSKQKLLSDALVYANAQVSAKANERHNNMGTTVVAALTEQTAVYISWAGDSRAYVFGPNGDEVFRTRDHGDGWGRITNFVGTPAGFQVDSVHAETFGGSVVVLCSDGVTNCLNDEEFKKACTSGPAYAQRSPTHMAESIINKVLLKKVDRQDNATCIVLCIASCW